MSKKLVLDEYEICLKMLEMAILDKQIFKNSWGACPQTPPGKTCAFGAHGTPLESPGYAPVMFSVSHCCNCRFASYNIEGNSFLIVLNCFSV